MVAFKGLNRSVFCMLMSAVIVAASLALGAVAAQSAAHVGYSVTITQLQ
ncbi:MAG TPA: hypothetical protein VKB34_07035 [Povalibacter sp.]|nr:hypothetical protein [Povalibacter sp.]